MKILNLSETTIYLDDIDVPVLYTRKREPVEIPDRLARRSRNLRYAIQQGLLLDVTKGIPDELPLARCEPDFATNPEESPFLARKRMLVEDDHFHHVGEAPRAADRPRTGKRSATREFHEDGVISVAWTGPTCFPPGTLVLTTNGMIPIEKIKIGDLVFTHNGRIRRVTSTYSRPYEGPMMQIKTALDSETIWVTPNHEVFVVRGVECYLRQGVICKPSCKKYEVERIPCSELRRNDFMLLPKLRQRCSISMIDIIKFTGKFDRYSHDKKFAWASVSPNKTYKSTVTKSSGFPIPWAYQVEKLGSHNTAMVSAALAEAQTRPVVYDPNNSNRIPRFYKLDYKTGRFFGLYVAKGHGAKSTLSFAFHEKETDLQNFIREFVKERIGLKSVARAEKGKRGISISFYNSIFTAVMEYICGHDAHTKRLPPFIFRAPDEFIDGFINGLWSGYDYRVPRKKNNTIKYATASVSLAYGLRFLLSKLGIIAGIHVESRSSATFRGKIYTYDNPKIMYVLRISGKQLYDNPWLCNFCFNKKPHKLRLKQRERQYFHSRSHGCIMVTKTDHRHYSGQVHNIEVENDHSYLVNGKAFKNCDAGGYALMNRQFMFGLADRGVNLRHDRLNSMPDMDKDTMDRLGKLTRTSIPKDAPKVYGMTAPLHYDWDRYKMLFTMMETRRLHPDYVERCNCADEIIVPTRWCKETFLESGVKRPISVVPLGVDTNLYRPGVEPIGFSKNLRGFVFLSVFGWSMRKGYDALLKAYLEEFSSDEDVTLLISSRYFGSTDESKKQVIRDDVARVSSMVRNPKKPHLVLFGDVLSVKMMPRLYAASDCFVLLSRGEGFCLPACEAAACGLPVIATNYSGQTDFLDHDNSYLVEIDGFRKAGKNLAWISYFYEDAEFPILGPGVVEQARVAMRRAYEEKDEAATKAKMLREKVITEYNWSTCVDRMHGKLGEYFKALPRP